jgi:tRNA threonylcarbamoyladenosine modification (KEOPS) complex Cgi121 subunit
MKEPQILQPLPKLKHLDKEDPTLQWMYYAFEIQSPNTQENSFSSIEIEQLNALSRNLNEELESKFNVSCQFFNSENLAGEGHLQHILTHIRNAFDQNVNISNQRSIEFLLYLSGQRQIAIALNSVGLNTSSIGNQIHRISVILFGDSTRFIEALSKVREEIYGWIEHPIEISEADTLLEIVEHYHISMRRIEDILRTLEGYKPVEENDLKTQILRQPYHLIQFAVLTAINERLIGLFLSNYKDAVSRLEKREQ